MQEEDTREARAIDVVKILRSLHRLQYDMSNFSDREIDRIVLGGREMRPDGDAVFAAEEFMRAIDEARAQVLKIIDLAIQNLVLDEQFPNGKQRTAMAGNLTCVVYDSRLPTIRKKFEDHRTKSRAKKLPARATSVPVHPQVAA